MKSIVKLMQHASNNLTMYIKCIDDGSARNSNAKKQQISNFHFGKK